MPHHWFSLPSVPPNPGERWNRSRLEGVCETLGQTHDVPVKVERFWVDDPGSPTVAFVLVWYEDARALDAVTELGQKLHAFMELGPLHDVPDEVLAQL